MLKHINPRDINLLAVLSLFAFMDAFSGLKELGASDQVLHQSLQQYERQIRPLLNEYCGSCHGKQKQKADIRFDTMNPDLVNGQDGDHWEEVLNQINTGEMPPKKEKQFTGAERRAITGWLTAQIRHATEKHRSTGGRNVMRRLTRYEYGNTMRDLLGIDLDFEAQLPPEGAAKEGFVNNSHILTMSSLHLEYFQANARMGLEKALASRQKPEVKRYVAEGNELKVFVSKKEMKDKKKAARRAGETKAGASKAIKGASGQNARVDGLWLKPHDKPLYFEFKRLPDTGPLLIRITAGSNHHQSQKPASMRINLGFNVSQKTVPPRMLTEIEVPASSSQPAVYEFHTRQERFFDVEGAFSKSCIRIFNVFDAGTNEGEKSPDLLIRKVELISPYYASWPPETRTDILFDSANQSNENRYAREVIERFMRRAYRRPVNTDEVDAIYGLYQTIRPRMNDFDGAIIDTLSAVLCSPSFLMIAEPATSASMADSARLLTDHELASRLSYFLWSTMPDETLSLLADEGRLQNPQILLKQVRRMLQDEKAEAFTKHFTSQWLSLDNIYNVAVNPEFFPDFDVKMKDEMIGETQSFLKQLLNVNGSALEMLNSNYAMLNAAMARHYGIKGVSGNSFRKVLLDPSHHRGGILTHASILTSNSTGDESHPIKRGVWLLENILGDPPPPPPPGVATLAEVDDGSLQLSVKAKLLKHREEASCRDCHNKIDPWGIAFENYDGIGRWRMATHASKAIAQGAKINAVESRRGKNSAKGKKGKKAKKSKKGKKASPPLSDVDPRTSLRDGTSIKHLEDLKSHLIKNKQAMFARNLVSKVMSYALGRHMSFTDKHVIDELVASFQQDDYRFRGLIESVVMSETFRKK